jgi:hypothetical protein
VSVRFYNAGDRIEEVLMFSIPNGQDVHCIARWPLRAPKDDFFDVPTELEFATTGESISVQFQRDITRKFGARGVIKIDPSYKPEKEEAEEPVTKYPFARNEREAVLRGREIWLVYLRTVVEGHLADCEAARAAGGAPKSARGFTKKALQELNIQDPGEQYFRSLQHGGAGEQAALDPAIAMLQAQNKMMMDLFMAVLAGKQIDPDALKKLAATPNAVGVNEEGHPVTSGVATGEIKKPIENDHGYETLTKGARNRGDRAKDAEKQL